MIPRTRANFSTTDLVRAAAISERSDAHRRRLRALLRAYLGVDDVLLTPSGRGGLYAILKALDRPRVIVPAYTCNAVVEAVLLAGKTVCYVDAAPGDFNTPAEAFRDLAGPDSIIVATHQFGIPCEIEKTIAVARSKGALVVEDAAASLGTRIDGKLTGTFADAAFFSFDVSKLVHVPLKGGAVIAKDPKVFARIENTYRLEIEAMPFAVKARTLASAGALLGIQGPWRYRLFHQWRFGGEKFTAEKRELDVVRTNYYRYDFTEWQAVVAIPQVERIQEHVHARQQLYGRYRELLERSRSFDLPPADIRREWACIRFPIRVHGDKLGFYRAAAAKGVDFAFSFTFIASPQRMRHAHDLARSVLDIPYYRRLKSAELDETVKVLREIDRTGNDQGQC